MFALRQQKRLGVLAFLTPVCGLTFEATPWVVGETARKAGGPMEKILTAHPSRDRHGLIG
jgi:hypothetical protein